MDKLAAVPVYSFWKFKVYLLSLSDQLFDSHKEANCQGILFLCMDLDKQHSSKKELTFV